MIPKVYLKNREGKNEIFADRCKYMLFIATHKTDETSLNVLRAEQVAMVHSGIINRAREEFSDYRLWPKGGGWLDISPNVKKIKIYGESRDYGPADIQKAAELLREAYPDFEIIVE